MTFKEYMHVEKFGNEEVEGIELGKVYVFPKLDGTNASTWIDSLGLVNAGSRTRQLSKDSDNAGFYRWVTREFDSAEAGKTPIWQFHYKYPHYRLFGEWLVPHTFKGYRQDAWKNFYVFDVFNDETEQYLSYEVYKPLVESFGITYIPPLATIKNGDYGAFLKFLEGNFFLIPDGGDPGEGIVLKNYDWQNRFGRQVWAKIIRNEFKELHARTMGAPDVNAGLMNEERIITRVVTTALVDKTLSKITNAKRTATEDPPFEKKDIPQLFERVFYDIIKEELWDAWKEIGFVSINGKTLKALAINKIKELKPEIFK